MEAGFADRLDAGRRLAVELGDHRGSEAIVLGLARGGVAVGFAVSTELQLPLRALVVRKVGAPYNPELALGAVSETGVQWLDWEIVRATRATAAYLEQEIAAQILEARRRQQEYSPGPTLETIRGRPVIVVDDGIATGSSALVAVQSARDLGAAHVTLATPVASPQAIRMLRPRVDRLVALSTPEPFLAVGIHYQQFEQLTDSEVVRYLQLANERHGTQAGASGAGG